MQAGTHTLLTNTLIKLAQLISSTTEVMQVQYLFLANVYYIPNSKMASVFQSFRHPPEPTQNNNNKQ